MKSWTWKTWVQVLAMSLAAAIIWLVIYDNYVEQAVFGATVSAVPVAEKRMCHQADPCGTRSTPQWQKRYRHDRVGHSRHGTIPPRILKLTRHAWVHWYNKRHRTTIARGRAARVYPRNFCEEVYTYSYLCRPLPNSGCVLSAYVCNPAPNRGAPVTGVNWRQVDRVTFKCANAAIWGGIAGGVKGTWAGALVGAGAGTGACAVDTIADAFDWW